MKKLLLLVIIALSVWIIVAIQDDVSRGFAGIIFTGALFVLVRIILRSKWFSGFFGIKKKPSVPNDIDLKIQVERELCKAKEFMEWVENENKKLQKELFLLKNPPKPSKFKVGDVFGKFAISQINGTSECNPHYCITKEGEVYRYSESQIEAMMKLNEKTTA